MRVVERAAGGQFSLGKSYPGFGPTGPWLVTVDELDDPNDLGLRCTLDDEVVQDARTGDMIVVVPGLLRVLSEVVALLPGDVGQRRVTVVGRAAKPRTLAEWTRRAPCSSIS